MATDDPLCDSRPGWRQLNIRFADSQAAERHAVDRLRPTLLHAQSNGLIASWFFIRKAWWRLRYAPVSAAAATDAKYLIEQAIGDVGRCVEGIYEPETHAFGGQPAMAAAHDLFHTDSRHILDHLTAADRTTTNAGRRRELSVLLCTAMMKAAGQDRYERGDIWAKIATHRPEPGTVPAAQWLSFKAAIRRLTTVDTSSATRHPGGPLASISSWLAAFEETGRTLGALSIEGQLSRGIRAIAAHHVIFHWNRLGLTVQTQAHIALAAKETAFQDDI